MRWATTIYRLALRALPPALRRDSGPDMLRTFRQLALRARGRGRLALWALVAREVTDVLTSGIGGRLAAASSLVFGAPQLARRLMRRPTHAFAVVATLALGVGASTAMFAVTDTVLADAPFPEPDRIVNVWNLRLENGNSIPGTDNASFLAWRGLSDVFERVEGFQRTTRVITDDGPPEQVTTAVVTPGLAELLGAHPIVGRGFVDPEGRPGDQDYAILGWDLWARRYGADPKLVGRTIELNRRRTTVVGVLPRGFAFPSQDTEVWLPVAATPAALSRTPGSPLMPGLDVVARLRPGLDLDAANAALRPREEALVEAGATSGYLPDIHDMGFFLTPERTRRTLALLMGAVLMVLLIAVANVVGLGLSQSLDRRRELAVREALGAGRRRLATELLLENLALALVGSAAGLGVATLVLRALLPMVPDQLGIVTWGRPLGIWPTGLFFALGAALVVAPAVTLLTWTRRGGEPNEALTNARQATPTRRGLALQQTIIAGQMALAVLLLAGSALVANSVLRLTRVDTGFDDDRLLLASLRIPTGMMSASTDDVDAGDHTTVAVALFDEFRQALERIPGVEAVTLTDTPFPLTSFRFRPELETPGRPTATLGVSAPQYDFLPIGEIVPGFLRTTGVKLLEGRDFTDADDPRTTVIVNRTLARQLWPDGSALGRSLRIAPRSPWQTVVGVVEPTVQGSLRDNWGAGGEIWVPLDREEADAYRTFLIRTDGREPRALVEPVRRAIWQVDPVQPIERLLPLRKAYGGTIDRERFFLALLGVFAGLATTLAACGIYALLARAVTRRTRELGIRKALGARPTRIFGYAVRTGLVPAGVGIGLGLAAAVPLGRLFRDLLYGIAPGDPTSMLVTASVLLGVAALAAAPPAIRALRTDVVASLATD